MPAAKRKSDASVTEPAKCARVTTPEASISRVNLEKLSKEELIDRVLQLERELAALPKPAVLSEAQISEKVEKARRMMVSGIEKQMKWTPSCKTGTARFTYEGHVSNAEVFLKLFGLPAENKKKMMQISVDDFERKVARDSVRASVRYAYLNIMGAHVNVRFMPEEGTF